ncbi:hypothetical protein TKK_0002863 [Trichogramma kaykai]
MKSIDNIEKNSDNTYFIKDNDENISTKYVATTTTCSCFDAVTMRLPCRHIFKIRDGENLKLFDESLILNRWAKEHYELKNPIYNQKTDAVQEIEKDLMQEMDTDENEQLEMNEMKEQLQMNNQEPDTVQEINTDLVQEMNIDLVQEMDTSEKKQLENNKECEFITLSSGTEQMLGINQPEKDILLERLKNKRGRPKRSRKVNAIGLRVRSQNKSKPKNIASSNNKIEKKKYIKLASSKKEID